LAGYRAAFVVGDPQLITAILEVRKHAGMMVPLPVQKAMVAGLGEDLHVAEQRARYNKRKATLTPALEAAGFSIEHSEAGLYLWATRKEDCWASVQWLAELGVIATPGIFYGAKGGQHIRIAMTATDEQIRVVATRIEKAIKG
jgi:aspartate/methionine/tyrosine aminotransferase